MAFEQSYDVLVALPEGARDRHIAMTFGVVYIRALANEEFRQFDVIFFTRHHERRDASLVGRIFEHRALVEQAAWRSAGFRKRPPRGVG